MLQNDKNSLDINALGETVGAQAEEFSGPDGRIMKRHSWSVENLFEGLKQVQPLADEGKPVMLSGGAPTWVMGAIAGRLSNCSLSFFIPETGELPIPRLPMGDQKQEGDIRFDVKTDGDRLFVDFMADDPNKPPTDGPHNYDLDKLKYVAVPRAKDNQHVFLRGAGRFMVAIAIALAYWDNCKSISMIFGPEPAYTCVASFCAEKAIGDKEPV